MSHAPKSTRGDSRTSVESSTPVSQRGHPLLITVPRGTASGGKGACVVFWPLDPRLPWHVGFELGESCRPERKFETAPFDTHLYRSPFRECTPGRFAVNRPRCPVSSGRCPARSNSLYLGGVPCDRSKKISPAFETTSKRRRGYPSETQVKRGVRIVHGDKLLEEKLGRDDLCPCGSGLRFRRCCLAKGRF